MLATVLAVSTITAGPAAADDGLVIASSTVFRVVPDEALIEVEATYTVTNTTPDRTTASQVIQYYYDRLTIPVPASATDVRARRSDGRRLDVSIDDTADLFLARALDVSFGESVFYLQSTTFTVSYVLASGEARDTASAIRVNPAYVVFNAWGLGDADAVDVRVEIPIEYDVTISGSDHTVSREGPLGIYEATDIADPEGFSLFIVARNDEALARRSVAIGGGKTVELRYWPGDEEWADFVTAELDGGLDRLAELIGITFPDDGLEILQSVDPTLLGYAGWYIPDRERIEVSEELDAEVLLHELSHAWFNGELFTERWIIEGLAQEFASYAATPAGNDVSRPPGPRTTSRYRVDLNRWRTPRSIDEQTRGVDRYGYDTSWFVMRQLSDEIGTEGLATAVRLAADDIHAYPGEAAPERVGMPVDDWRRFLDLLEESAGSEKATALFDAYVVSADQSALLDDRRRARRAYHDLQARSGRWAPPLIVRMELGDWEFASASVLIDQANRLLDQRDRLVSVASGLDLTVVDSPEQSYQAASTTMALSAVGVELSDLEAAADDLAEAAAELAARRSLIERIGLAGSDVGTQYEDARRAFEDGDTELARDLAGGATAELRGAAPAGGRRLAVVVLGSGLLIGAIGFRRRRPPSGRNLGDQVLDGLDGGPSEHVEVRARVGIGPEGQHELPVVGQDGDAEAEVEPQRHDGHHLPDPSSSEVQRSGGPGEIGGDDIDEGLVPGHPGDEVDRHRRQVIARLQE